MLHAAKDPVLTSDGLVLLQLAKDAGCEEQIGLYFARKKDGNDLPQSFAAIGLCWSESESE